MKTFILDSFYTMLGTMAGILPTIFKVLAILIVGWIVARTAGKVVTRLFKELRIDDVALSLGLTGVLRKGGIRRTTSDLLGCFTYWIILITTLIASSKAFGLEVVDTMVVTLFGYVPKVLGAVFVLVFGMILGHFVSQIVKVVASNTDLPKPDVMGMLVKYAIIIFSVTIFIEEIGLGGLLIGTTFQMVVGSICLALALSFGLGGRDKAARYLDKVTKA